MKYYRRLDGLRAIAVAAVLYTHYLPLEYWLFDIYWGGYGVRLFFVLSGFLITQLLLADHEQRTHSSNEFSLSNAIFRFYLRRFFRLTPVLLATVSVAAFFNFNQTRETIFWHVTYLSNIKMALDNSWLGMHGPLWSLSVEEQFYFLWPFAIFLCSRKSVTRICLLSVPIVLMYRIFFNTYFPSEIAKWVLLPYSMDALLIGGLVGLLHLEGKLNHKTSIFTALAGICLLYCILEISELIDIPEILTLSELGITLICVPFAWLIVASCMTRSKYSDYLLGTDFIVFFGKISYGIYLMHTFVHHGVVRSMEALQISMNHPVVVGVIATIATVVLASISWKCFESPILYWRNRTAYLK